MENIKIADVEIYAGKKVDNDINKYINHFKSQGKNVEHLYKDVLGRNSRVLRNSDTENTLTMSVKSIKKLLNKNNLLGSDIDLIVFSSQTPEFLTPPTSIMVHKQIDGKSSATCFDVNVSCAGMVTAFTIIYEYMRNSSNIQRAILVGCDLLNLISDPDNELTYGQFGDVACSILLEKSDYDCKLLGYYSCIQTQYADKIIFPAHGFSNAINELSLKDKFIIWENFEGTSSVKPSAENIKRVLNNNNLKIEDISFFCCSQVSLQNIQYMAKELKIESDRIPYIANHYGYTATTSPFLVFYHLLKLDKIKKGDYIIFWGVGAGWQTSVVLIKY